MRHLVEAEDVILTLAKYIRDESLLAKKDLGVLGEIPIAASSCPTCQVPCATQPSDAMPSPDPTHWASLASREAFQLSLGICGWELLMTRKRWEFGGILDPVQRALPEVPLLSV